MYKLSYFWVLFAHVWPFNYLYSVYKTMKDDVLLAAEANLQYCPFFVPF